MKRNLLTNAALTCLLLAAAGCGRGGPGGGDGGKPLTHTVKIDVGGAVVYAGDTSIRLPGVTVTLTDVDGDTWTATTADNGLWTVEDLRPGVYVETYEAAGYETQMRSFGLDAYGENDVKNVFVPLADAALEETKLRADVSGSLAVTVMDGDHPIDGFGGTTLTYSVSSGAPLIVTFSRVLFPVGDVFIDDGDTFDADRTDTATQTVFTFQAGDLAQMNADNDPQTFAELRMEDLLGLTPIHGDFESFNAVVRFNAVP